MLNALVPGSLVATRYKRSLWRTRDGAEDSLDPVQDLDTGTVLLVVSVTRTSWNDDVSVFVVVAGGTAACGYVCIMRTAVVAALGPLA